MREIMNTAQYERIPNGKYLLTVLGEPEEMMMGKAKGRKWTFKFETTEGNLVKDQESILLPPWKSRDLVIALGGTPIDNTDNVEWDPSTVDGRMVTVDLINVAYRKKDGTNGQSYEFKSVEEYIGF